MSDSLAARICPIAPPFTVPMTFPDIEPAELERELAERETASAGGAWQAYLMRVLPAKMPVRGD
jgi:hypothetical protein